MPISRQVSEKLEKSAWIRKMFEEGLRMKQEHGADNVFDLSLGNPVVEPPEEVRQAIVSAASNTTPGLHRYMPNAGLTDVREAVARNPITPIHILEKLAGDESHLVRIEVGYNPNTPKAILDKLPDKEKPH